LHELSQISQRFSGLLEVNWCEFVKFVSGSLALFGVFGGQIFDKWRLGELVFKLVEHGKSNHAIGW
jgi:hypothetical protein